MDDETAPKNAEKQQRRAHGLRNEEYLRLKVLACMLPAL
jgi:hypothetical protein